MVSVKREPTEMERRAVDAMLEHVMSGDMLPFLETLTEHPERALFQLTKIAIRAMRAPTPEMYAPEGVHRVCHMCGGADDQWPLMIDAASPPEEK